MAGVQIKPTTCRLTHLPYKVNRPYILFSLILNRPTCSIVMFDKYSFELWVGVCIVDIHVKWYSILIDLKLCEQVSVCFGQFRSSDPILSF